MSPKGNEGGNFLKKVGKQGASQETIAINYKLHLSIKKKQNTLRAGEVKYLCVKRASSLPRRRM